MTAPASREPHVDPLTYLETIWERADRLRAMACLLMEYSTYQLENHIDLAIAEAGSELRMIEDARKRMKAKRNTADRWWAAHGEEFFKSREPV